MSARLGGRERPGLPHLVLLAFALPVAGCPGRNAGGLEDTGVPVVDIAYALPDADVTGPDAPPPADSRDGDPGAPCADDGCAADEGPGGPGGEVDSKGCVEPADWQCTDGNLAQRCRLGQIEVRECLDSEACDRGVCMPICAAGTANCSLDPALGCNVDTTSDPAHCGNCATDCGDAPCVHGSCMCASVTQAATSSPLDLFIMMDQSSSMDDSTGTGISKWDAVSQALRAFVTDGASAGIGVGIQYFPLLTGSGYYASESCTVADYARAETPIVALPGNAQALIDSMDAHGPDGNTPTWPALRGALNFAKLHATKNPTHAVVVILATDGEPTECDPQDIPAIALLAANAAGGNPAIRTFVVGVGSLLGDMDQIAAAGGTQKAFVVDQGGNVVQQFADALHAIRGQALGCSYGIPEPVDGQALNYNKVDVQVSLGGASPSQPGYSEDAAACEPSGGWYFDDPVQPHRILLCPATCTAVVADPKARVDILLGCWRSGYDTH